MVKNYELIEIESTVQIGVIDIRLGVIIICLHKALKLVLMDVTDVEVKPRSLGTRHLFVFLGENLFIAVFKKFIFQFNKDSLDLPMSMP